MKKRIELLCGNVGGNEERIEIEVNSELELKDFENAVLCIPEIPLYMDATDICHFVAPFYSTLCHIRLLRQLHKHNTLTALLQFRNIRHTKAFVAQVSGKLFSSLGETRCEIVSLSSIRVISTSSSSVSTLVSNINWSLSYENDNCPVCLEPLVLKDSKLSSRALITTVCNHSLHADCLANWGDDRCAVCRFRQQPAPESDVCSECERLSQQQAAAASSSSSTSGKGLVKVDHEMTELWMCLLCGNVGCSRTNQRHALQHFKNTNHTFAVSTKDGKVWDYAGDNYVQRLIANKADGKLVELRELSASEGSEATEHPDEILAFQIAQLESKHSALQEEYAQLLHSHLVTQQEYFQQKQNEYLMASYERQIIADEELKSVCKSLELQRIKLKNCSQSASERNRCVDLTETLKKTTAETEALQEMIRAAQSNCTEYESRTKSVTLRIDDARSRVQSLEVQLCDLFLQLDQETKSQSDTRHEKNMDDAESNPDSELNQIAGGAILGIADAPTPIRSTRRSQRKNSHRKT